MAYGKKELMQFCGGNQAYMTFDLQTIGEKKTFMEMIVKSVIDIVSDYCSFIPNHFIPFAVLCF